jgi:DNA uptake protein ComE-like DNA-binding protein
MKEPTLSKSSLRGTLIFVSLLSVVFVFPDLWMHFHPGEKAHLRFSDPDTRKAVTSVRRNLSFRDYRNDRRNRYSAPPAAFDPNTYTLEEWMALGLSEKQAAVVLKFTRYGVYSNEDIKRIFVIPDELYELIRDSTRFPERRNNGFRPEAGDRSFVEEPVKAPRKVNINTATPEELMEVKGIGPFFAKHILRQRDALGGFYDESQLLEVWKMDAEKAGEMSPYLVFDESALRKINLNTATAEELKTHPYISWNLANSIVKLRSQNGPYHRVEDVKKSALMTADLFEKLKRYFTVDP